jgi:hypothetical protein
LQQHLGHARSGLGAQRRSPDAFQVYEQAYFAERYGLLGPAEWRRFERQLCQAHSRAQSSADISTRLSQMMTEEFMAFIAETCRE